VLAVLRRSDRKLHIIAGCLEAIDEAGAGVAGVVSVGGHAVARGGLGLGVRAGVLVVVHVGRQHHRLIAIQRFERSHLVLQILVGGGVLPLLAVIEIVVGEMGHVVGAPGADAAVDDIVGNFLAGWE